MIHSYVEMNSLLHLKICWQSFDFYCLPVTIFAASWRSFDTFGDTDGLYWYRCNVTVDIVTRYLYYVCVNTTSQITILRKCLFCWVLKKRLYFIIIKFLSSTVIKYGKGKQINLVFHISEDGFEIELNHCTYSKRRVKLSRLKKSYLFFLFYFFYLASPQGQGHHNSVRQLLWAHIT